MSRLELVKSENKRVDQLTEHFLSPVPFAVKSAADLERLRSEWVKRDSIPCQVASRDLATDHSWPGMDVRTLLSGDNSSGRISVHDIVVAPGAGLPAHYQQASDAFLFVVDGEIELTVGRLCEVSRPKSYAYIPARTTTALQNKSAAPARLYVLYSPAGLDRAFAEAHDLWVKSKDNAPAPYLAVLARYGFCFDRTGPLDNDARTKQTAERLDSKVASFEDFASLREKWVSRPAIPKLIHGAAKGRRLRLSGPDASCIHGLVMASGDETRGRAVFFLGEATAGYEAGPHYQPSEEELFFVVDGELALTCGSKTRLVKAGGFGFAPRGATHAFRNTSNSPTWFITLNSPAGHERGFEQIMEHERNPTEGFIDLLAAHGWQLHEFPMASPE